MHVPENQNFWTIQSKALHNPLYGKHETDVVVIGGGMAGISAAARFQAMGLNVILVEKYLCGAGASGKSSGFVTPNSELGLTHYVNVYGPEKAKMMWDFVTSGTFLIHDMIQKYGIACDYIKEDVLITATSASGYKELEKEHKNYAALGYPSSLYTKQQIPAVLQSNSYYGGMQFGNNFGINSFMYLQGMKIILEKQGVRVFEESPVVSFDNHTVTTLHGTIKTRYIVVCVDKNIGDFEVFKQKVFQVQTFILMSEPCAYTIQEMFPRERLMCWDTDLVYQYFRTTQDNRLLIGGSSLLDSFQYHESCHNHRVYKKLSSYIKQKFPQLTINFEYMWPGMIGISKDLTPLAGRDRQQPNIYYITAATGLAWAAALGSYAAENLIDKRTDMDAFFDPYRKFPLGDFWHYIIGKRATFALSNLISMKR